MYGALRDYHEYITITREVTKSNIILFHEGLGTYQIRKRPVHIKILKDKDRMVNTHTISDDRCCMS